MGRFSGQATKTVIFNGPATEATNATNSAYIDTFTLDNASHLEIEVAHNPATGTNSSAKWTSLRLLDGAVTNISSGTAITGATGTTNSTTAAGEFILPVHNDTSVAGIVKFVVPLASYERYIHVEAQCAASHHTVTYTARVSQGNSTSSDTDQGANEVVYV